MKLDNITHVYFVGIGGIGMSALARYFVHKGCIVNGYDKTCTGLCAELEAESMKISYDDSIDELGGEFLMPHENTLVVYTPAIPKDSALLNFFRKKGFNVFKRSEVLGFISRDSFCIAVAGTHGKTTTSALIAHILTHSGYGCSAFLGGILTNYNSNYLFSSNNVVVVEADEYDRSFLTLSPDISIITSMDADHLDIYGDAASLVDSFKHFATKLKANGFLLKKAGLPLDIGLEYAYTGLSPYRADAITATKGAFVFDYIDEVTRIEQIRFRLPGNHNVENAVAAIAVALHLGIAADKIKLAVEAFMGVKRRFQIVVDTERHVYIDDYAHHPEELRACLSAVKMLYPNKKLTVAFQPHLYSRTLDFAQGFAEVLAQADQLLLLDIYPARELPVLGVDAQMLLNMMGNGNREICSLNNLVSRIKELQPELMVTVGAGNIDTVVGPIKEVLKDA